MDNDKEDKQNSKQLYAVFLGGALHGTAVSLVAAGTPRHAVGMHEVVTGYRLATKQNGALPIENEEQRYFYLADDLFPGDVAKFVAQFWAMASPAPDA